MKLASPALLVSLVVAAVASAQEPSAKDLRTLLHADVKQYAHDGRLVATWSLVNPDQLNGFKRQDERAIKIVQGEGLAMTHTKGGVALCLFKELEFEQPSKLAFEIKPEDPDAAFEMQLYDPASPQLRLVFGLNLPTPSGRIDLIGRMENGKPVGRPRIARSSLSSASWAPVVIDLRTDKASLTVGKVEQAVLEGVSFKRFATAFGASAGKATMRNLAIDTQVNRDSIRKLFRAVSARPTSRPKLGDVGALSKTAWEKVDEECSTLELSDAASAEIDALPAEAQKAIEAGLAPEAKPKDVLESFEKAIKIAPKSAVALWLGGLAAADADQPDKAVEHLEKAVAADPKLAPAWLALGENRAERAEDALALKAFAQAETLDPADPWVHVARARLAFERGRLDDTRRDVEKAIAKRPDSTGLKLLSKSLEKLAVRPDWKDSFKKENQWYCVETTISSKAAADMAQRLVVYRRFLEKAFPIPLKQGLPPSRVWIFDSEDEYRQFANSIASGMDGTLGLYHRLIKTLLLTSKVSAETTQHILFHEGFHQYLDLAVSRAPIWMNEGLAEYYGATTFDIHGNATQGGLVAMRLSSLGSRLVALEKLMMMPPGKFMDPRFAGLHYAQSWAFVHFCKQGGNASAAKQFDLYCTAVIAGKSQADAFALTFGQGAELAGIEADFRNYVKTRLLKTR